MTAVLEWLKKRLFPPVEPTERFTEEPKQIAQRLGNIAYSEARDLLAHAERLYDEPSRRSETAERRATAVLASAGIAAGLTTAGAGLLLDSARIGGTWRIAIATTLGLAIVCLLMASLRALTTLRVLNWHVPDEESLIPIGQADVLPKTILRAATLLHKGARNEGNARWKIALARAAAWWFTRAVVLLLLTAVLLVGFIATTSSGNAPASGDGGRSSTPPARSANK